MNRLMRRQNLPGLAVDILDNQGFDLSKTKPDCSAMLVSRPPLRRIPNLHQRARSPDQQFSRRGIEQSAAFGESSLVVARPDGMLHWSSASTVPFARQHISEMLRACGLVRKINYPARGEL